MKHKIFSVIINLLPRKLAHKLLYKRRTGKTLDLRNPKDLNEKLQYLMIYKFGRKEAYLSDKYEVKEYLKTLNIKDLNIIKTIKTFKNADEIDIDLLPDKFMSRF